MPESRHAELPVALQADIQWKRLSLQLDDGYATPLFRIASRTAPATRTVVYLHGIQSHPAWFAGSCQALAAAGCEVFAPTRRGSGENARDRGDCRNWRQLLDDIECSVRFALAQGGRATAAMIGVSWGGKLATLYCLERSSPIDALALVAPGIIPQVSVPLHTRLAIGLAGVFRPARIFDIPLSDPALFTDNPAMREYLRTDPHRLHQATARFLIHSALMDVKLRQRGRKVRSGGSALAMPTTLLLAQRDRIMDNAATRQVVESLTSGKVAVAEFSAAHTLDFEPQNQPFFTALINAVTTAIGRKNHENC